MLPARKSFDVLAYGTCFWRRGRVLSRLGVCICDPFLLLLDLFHVEEDGRHDPAMRVYGSKFRV
jgi:hypothetical protein